VDFHLLVAPPGAGKTTRLLERARQVADRRGRVWWVGLPSQRNYLYRRATAAGPLLGLEFLSPQQVYYRLLAHALKLKPLVVGTGRLALVGEVLREIRGELPAPGEARLFARAIAEVKRYGLTAAEVPGEDEESRRFREVYRSYEAIKGNQWDYDDFRSESVALVEGLERRAEADLLVVDGFREVGPLELRLYRALARHAEVWLSLPEAPPGERPSELLAGRAGTSPVVYRAANPVTEARWVLRSLKRDLAEGLDPLELAVILPEREVRSFLALADEYGVPLMDETAKALADTLPGRLLLDLLDLPEYPTASRLLAIPELAPLARAALREGVAGFEAIAVLAQALDLEGLWRKWLRLLEVDGDEMTWAAKLIDNGLPAIRRDLLVESDMPFDHFRRHALQRAKEASRLARGPHFRPWWGALLQETFLFERPLGGVALLTAKLASGRRFRRAYLMQANEGIYTTAESEDYFIPEEQRSPLDRVFKTLGLPRRFLGRDRSLHAELRSRAQEVVITFPEADQGGPLLPELELLAGATPLPLPELPAGSRLELTSERPYRAEVTPLELGEVSLQKLSRYAECGFRYWAEEVLPAKDELPWWLALLNDLRAFARLNPATIEELRSSYPQAAAWLTDHAERLSLLSFGVTLPEVGEGPRAYLDAAGRRGGEVTFYRFTEPERVVNREQAADYLNARWNELWAAGYMLDHYPGRITRVDIFVWPLLGEAISAFEGGITYRWRRILNRQRQAREAYRRFARGAVDPTPGFHCRRCRVFDLCREGKR